MAGLIIKYSIDKNTGKSVYIENAANGLSCNCICSECGGIMVAVQGEQRKREWHFRHYEDTNCKGGIETAIHKYAKQIIIENTEMVIPNGKLTYSLGRQEEPFQSIIPDVTVTSNDGELYFEIFVTNPVDREKESFYKTGMHKSIEIDLSNVSYDVTPSELKDIVINRTGNKRIIFWTAEKVSKSTSDSSILILLLAIGTFLMLLFTGRRTKKYRKY